MIVLTLRTDKPQAEIGLFEDGRELAYETWAGHRELSATLLKKIVALLKGQQKKFADLQGIVVFSGPGSFTGLRIGVTAANSLAYGLGIPITATAGEEWVIQGITRLQHGDSGSLVLPEYGALPHTTLPRK